MLNDRYQVETNPDFQSFDFVSIGPQGAIAKAVRYTELDQENVYNLGFGDRDPTTGYISDVAVSDNGDGQKVLATVAATLYAFTAHYPEALVIATGTTKARTRLYRIGITTNLAAIEKDFVLLGYANETWESFHKNVEYDAFLVKRKIH